MILFTAGYPYSGKTELVKLITSDKALVGQVKVTLVDPVLLRPPEYNQMPPDDQRAARLASWEVAQEQLREVIVTEPNTALIIYDSCAAKLKTMLPHFSLAKARGHSIFYTFVGAKVDECKGRAGTNWPPSDVINGYAADFGESAPRLRPLCTHFRFIKNSNDPEKTILKDAASKLAKAILDVKTNRVPQSAPARGATSRS
jgi:hypothetical protein